MTRNQRGLDSAVIRSSLMPSEKYSCSGSPAHVGERKYRDGGSIAKHRISPKKWQNIRLRMRLTVEQESELAGGW